MRYFFLFLILFFHFNKIIGEENTFTEFLVAKPHMQDSRFQETVIIMLYHNQKNGAAGFVVNKPIKTMHISELFKINNINTPENMIKKEIILYWGGPVEPEHIFFIHSSDYKSNDIIFSNKDFTITRAPEILLDIARNKGPEEYIILFGIAAWEPGQLDSEMVRGDWDKKINNYTSLFDNGKEMWIRLVSSQDI